MLGIKHIRIVLLLIAVVACAPAHGGLLGIDGEQHSSIGIVIRDLRTDSVLIASDADRALSPASVMKSLTAASALTLLGPDYRFTTTASLIGALDPHKYGVWRGWLSVASSGDPTLESARFADYGGFADSIVTALQHHGITAIDGSVEVLQSLQQPGPVDTWQIDDVAWAYGAGYYDFNWRDNVCKVWPATGVTRPRVPGLRIECIEQPRGTNLLRGAFSDKLLAYAPDVDNPKWVENTTMPDPSAVFKAELASKLAQAGITVTNSEGADDDNDQELVLTTHQSAPMLQILRTTVKESENMFAEGILRTFAPSQNRKAAVNAQLELWQQRGLPTQYVAVADGSGLSRSNRLSANFLADMLTWMARSPQSKNYVSLLPVAGVDGTMRSFMADTRLKGRLALKTGSMAGVQCYAGYKLDSANRPTHVVVILVNSFFCSRPALKAAVAKLLLKYL